MSSSFSLQYAPKALEDLKAIYRYIASELKAPQAAKGQVTRIRDVIRSLKNSPSKYEAVDWEPWASLNVRRVPVNNYIIFYTVNEEEKLITVIRIFYSGRNIEQIVKDGI